MITGDDDGSDGEHRLKKSVQNELQSKLQENGGRVLPSEINPTAPGQASPLHIPLSTAIRVVKEREERREAMMMDPKSRPVTPNGTLTRNKSAVDSGEKLMISHGKRNFSVKKSPTTLPRVKTQVAQDSLLAGDGKMSNQLRQLVQDDVVNGKPMVAPARPPLTNGHSTNNSQSEPRGARSPEAVEISDTLRRLISEDQVDNANGTLIQIPVTNPEVVCKVIAPETNYLDPHRQLNGTSKSPWSPPATPVNGQARRPKPPQMQICPQPPAFAATVPRKSNVRNPLSPSSRNGSLIDTSILLPLPPRVPSPPPSDNPKRFQTQLSCDRLNAEFQEYNAFRTANPPSPKKLDVKFEVNGAPNFEKKTVVSFAQEMAATPNRYPEVVKVLRTVPPSSTKGTDQTVTGMDNLRLTNVKFIIDPTKEEVIQVTN